MASTASRLMKGGESEEHVSLVFTFTGIYGITPTGGYTNIVGENWSTITVAVAMRFNYSEVIAFGSTGIFKINTRDRTYEKVNSENWGTACVAIVDSIHDKEFINVLCSSGCWRVDVKTWRGSHLRRGLWGDIKAVSFDADNRTAVVVCGEGAFALDMDSGSYAKLPKSSTFSRVTASLITKDRKSIVMLSSKGIERMKGDGSVETVSKEKWLAVPSAGALSSDGDSGIIVGCAGVFRIDPCDAKLVKINTENWGGMSTLCRLGHDRGIGMTVEKKDPTNPEIATV